MYRFKLKDTFQKIDLNERSSKKKKEKSINQSRNFRADPSSVEQEGNGKTKSCSWTVLSHSCLRARTRKLYRVSASSPV